MRQLTIDSCAITDDSDGYVIAEIGHNHQGDLEKAKELFRCAKECGVDAVKLQKRDNRNADFLAALDMPACRTYTCAARSGGNRKRVGHRSRAPSGDFFLDDSAG